MPISKEDFAREHLRRAGNKEPNDESIQTYIKLIDKDPWVNKLYHRADAMTAEDYLSIPTIEPEDNNE